MKICNECHTQVPDKLLACEVCCRKRSRAALRTYQLDPLRKVKAGKADLRIRQIKDKRHVQMFGVEQTYCGLGLSYRDIKSRASWEPIGICTSCHVEVLKLMEEACSESH